MWYLINILGSIATNQSIVPLQHLMNSLPKWSRALCRYSKNGPFTINVEKMVVLVLLFSIKLGIMKAYLSSFYLLWDWIWQHERSLTAHASCQKSESWQPRLNQWFSTIFHHSANLCHLPANACSSNIQLAKVLKCCFTQYLLRRSSDSYWTSCWFPRILPRTLTAVFWHSNYIS